MQISPEHLSSSPNGLTIEAATALIDSLSPRQEDVLGTIALGLTAQGMAEEFFLAVSTVKSHASSIYAALGVNSQTGAREITGMARFLQSAYESEDEETLPVTRKVIEKHHLSLEETMVMDGLRLRIHDLNLLKFAAEGMTNREISEQFFIEESTLKSRKNMLYSRLGRERLGKTVKLLSNLGQTVASATEAA